MADAVTEQLQARATDSLPEQLSHPLAPLAPGEVRVYTLDSGDREIVRQATRHVLGAHAGVSAADITLDVGDKGKPYLLNDRSLYFSVSHSHDLSMLAVTRVADTGVDIERQRAVPRAEEILRRFFSHEELTSMLSDDNRDLRFVQAWTRGEATVKVRGASIWEAATPDPSVTVRALHAPDEFAAAIAVGGGSTGWYVTQVSLAINDIVPAQPSG